MFIKTNIKKILILSLYATGFEPVRLTPSDLESLSLTTRTSIRDLHTAGIEPARHYAKRS